MQGSLWVESEPGKGSCFHCTIVVGVSPTLEKPREGEVSLGGVRILVVDDNATNRGILTGLLDGWGARPVAVAGVREALAAMRRAAENHEPFQAVLTDVHMPEMDGFDLVEQMKEAPDLTGSLVLMLTSGEHFGDLARCHQLGVSAYLVKPVRRADLRAALCQAIANDSHRQQPAGPRQEQPVPLIRERAGPKLRILLAEDNIVNQRVGLRILEKAGHQVAIVNNGKEALDALDGQAFDMVLMDIQMPEMGGFEATSHIRKKEIRTGGHIPVVAMTAHAMAGYRERCLEAGMDDYITKPINAEALLSLIAAVCVPAPKDQEPLATGLF